MSREIFDVVNERDEVIEQKSRPTILPMNLIGLGSVKALGAARGLGRATGWLSIGWA